MVLWTPQFWYNEVNIFCFFFQIKISWKTSDGRNQANNREEMRVWILEQFPILALFGCLHCDDSDTEKKLMTIQLQEYLPNENLQWITLRMNWCLFLWEFLIYIYKIVRKQSIFGNLCLSVSLWNKGWKEWPFSRKSR